MSTSFPSFLPARFSPHPLTNTPHGPFFRRSLLGSNLSTLTGCKRLAFADVACIETGIRQATMRSNAHTDMRSLHASVHLTHLEQRRMILSCDKLLRLQTAMPGHALLPQSGLQLSKGSQYLAMDISGSGCCTVPRLSLPFKDRPPAPCHSGTTISNMVFVCFATVSLPELPNGV